ncbi:hypothetical protein [Methanimicrococcus blatticola]|uniref:Uncharacterized protein n=1 Tax=Methanimicrococcus blatticola TaxID=91560 RepID=A0A484F3Y5_9EURY|nr:hypothetical protein [Methanimicrococcus blatticola]MBZ3936078.1 hypothetical protein [Methanimicrococcus blatticola]MCC2509313.1 hypothetical protein [Methanimicrococcus blatticola]TDQ68198.1 hypothetical protein C7391_1135 [Methanimicrococcus blatticola]
MNINFIRFTCLLMILSLMPICVAGDTQPWEHTVKVGQVFPQNSDGEICYTDPYCTPVLQTPDKLNGKLTFVSLIRSHDQDYFISIKGTVSPGLVGNYNFGTFIKEGTDYNLIYIIEKGPQTIFIDTDEESDVSEINLISGEECKLDIYSKDISDNKIDVSLTDPELIANHQPVYSASGYDKNILTYENGVITPKYGGTTTIRFDSIETESYKKAETKELIVHVDGPALVNPNNPNPSSNSNGFGKAVIVDGTNKENTPDSSNENTKDVKEESNAYSSSSQNNLDNSGNTQNETGGESTVSKTLLLAVGLILVVGLIGVIGFFYKKNK